MDLFDIIPDNFFSPLASPNKRLYLASIIEAFKVYETGSILGIDKKIVVDDLTHYLENEVFSYSTDDEEDDEAKEIESKRDLANYILRKLEECGWIYVDVTNDYVEVLNFSDCGITMAESLMSISPVMLRSNGSDEEELYIPSQDEYHGYIYTIYSLLTNKDNIEYGVLLSQIYKNTKLLIRSLRKLDSRLKDYISSVVETAEIKDLMEKLIMYKQELFDPSYSKIKTSDNVNKYRLKIVGELENIQNDEKIMKLIAIDYRLRAQSDEEALKKANRDIDEIIDVFNSLDDFVSEIDLKNKTYINSTIGKIKFLLSEDDNVIGKINSILKFVKDQNKENHLDKAMATISPLFHMNGNRIYNTQSLYTPRGAYAHNYNQILDTARFDDLEITGEFLKQFDVPYNEQLVGEFLNKIMKNGEVKASEFLLYDSPNEVVLNLVYSVVYASERNFDVSLLDGHVYHQKFTMRDFIIKKRG